DAADDCRRAARATSERMNERPTDIIRPVAGLDPTSDSARARTGDGVRPMTELVRIGWERIQLILALRGSSPADPRLEHHPQRPGEPGDAAEPGEPMTPTWSGDTDAGRMLRFNVMLGPSQAPLADGSWILCAAPGEPLVLDRP